MLEGRSIVCFAHDWGGDPTSKTHIMRILARRNRVLWVESIGLRRPGATARDLRRILRKLRRGLVPVREAEPNLFVASPLVVPLPGSPFAERLNAWLLRRLILRWCRRRGGERPILWSFLPNVGGLVGRLGESLVVYHCVDEYVAFTGVPRLAIREREMDFVRRADLVLASSERLSDERRRLNPNTHFVTHGVDVSHFGRGLDRKGAIPDDLKALRPPVVGFFGLLADWVDLDLVAAVARARPGWSFALLGRAAAPLDAVRGLPNVHLLGPKPYERLPDYCRGFDAAIIPFRSSELTLRANPLKLREYLAAGLPVVSTPLPEVARYQPHVRMAEDAERFAAALARAIEERGPGADRARAEAVRQEGWEVRVAEIERLLLDSSARPRAAARRRAR